MLQDMVFETRISIFNQVGSKGSLWAADGCSWTYGMDVFNDNDDWHSI